MLIRFYKNHDKQNGADRSSVLFFCVVVCICLFSALNCEAYEGKVKHVIDGDTFVLENNEIIRIASIDTPEIGREGKPDQYYAKESSEILKELLLNKVVRVEPVKKGKDNYGRTIGWVYLDNYFVNEIMVEKGAAFFYFHPYNDSVKQDLLLQAQRKAMSEVKGFWRKISSLKDFNIKWVGNMRSRRCFRVGSNFSVTIMNRNKVRFSTLGEAFMEGYTPARASKFWPNVTQ
ncbi:thermonuclease family protein [Maridesulfovibrio ferrireducens]|uniref:thermonuclease family protein n=1 Tax=Maridesulfovibrio ferrireducens TaxID=246191 RepID=UPI0026EBB9F9|nr:thermonuclease family protein [Maridesulfovibrio ferrireducens]